MSSSLDVFDGSMLRSTSYESLCCDDGDHGGGDGAGEEGGEAMGLLELSGVRGDDGYRKARDA
jgi:hypothetical protein